MPEATPAPHPAGVAREIFRKRYGAEPDFVAFAPGRVNLIGEHVDYCGLPVLPAALSRGIALALRTRSDAHVCCFSREFEGDEAKVELGSDAPTEGFGRYLAAAGAGLLAGGWIPADAVGFDGAIASDLPSASGLSSSSALVVAAALALLAVGGRLTTDSELPEDEARRLALDLAEAEHGVSIQGGAMDQSIALGAVAGHALSIAFDPPGWTPVAVDPNRFALLVAFSGVHADKGGAAGVVFDQRVREANAALALAQRSLEVTDGYPQLIANRPLDELLTVAKSLPDPFGRRFRHIVTEAHRTRRANDALRNGDAEELGALLDASHQSLANDYEVSTPELDALVTEARGAGALGARLTGAGLGGSVVILARPSDKKAIREQLREHYYAPRGYENPEAEPALLLDGTPAGPAALLPGQTDGS